MPKTEQGQEPASEPDTFRNQDEITLGMLTAIERDANLSQRMMSSELGVALGLANSYLKRCVRKGWIKIQQVPPRRYAYFLTPQGFSEKARLTGNYLSSSFTFFRRAREQMSDLLEHCVQNGWRRVAFAGVSELAEVGILSGQDFDITLVGVIEETSPQEKFLGLPVVGSLGDLRNVDAVIITDLIDPHAVHQAIASGIGDKRTLAPKLLQLSRRRPAKGRKARQAAE